MGSRTDADIAKSLANALAGERPPPSSTKLTGVELVYWGVIMRARARDEWAESDLYVAAELARTLADQQRIRDALRDEGDTLVNSRGTVVANPKHDLLETLARRIMAMRKDLLIHSASLAPHGGITAEVKPKREEEALARDALALVAAKHGGDDDLLASPLSH